MKIRITAIAAICGFLGLGYMSNPDRLRAQAPAGPLPSPQSLGIPVPPPTARPKRREPKPRTTIGGTWKLNHDESDDPSRKIKDLKKSGGNSSNYPGRGGVGVGFPFPGAGGPMGGGMPRGQSNGDGKNDPKLLDAVLPAENLSIDLKTSEVDVTQNGGRKLIFYTDGRQLQKPKDATIQEIAAHWDGSRLVSDEKSPEKGKMSRTFELSQDGRQFYETLNVETNRSKTPVVIQYVYDISAPEAELTHATDPDQPIMKRRSADTSSASSQDSGAQQNQPPDPDQPVMKRRSDDSDTSTTQNPQTQPSSAPDPDQPVMKRRTDGSTSPSQ